MTEIVIFFAGLFEAKELLYHSKFKFIKETNFYKSEITGKIIKVFITGIGKGKTKSFLDKFELINKYSIYIKAGSCAILDDNIKILELIIPKSVKYKNTTIEINKIPIGKYSHKGVLETLDKPLFDVQKKEKLFETGTTFADMETFFFAEYFQEYLFLPLICGSDNGTNSGKFEFLLNIKKVSKILSDELINFTNLDINFDKL